MRTKDEILKALGVNAEYNPHGGAGVGIKDVVLTELLIDFRDIFSQTLVALDRIGERLENLK